MRKLMVMLFLKLLPGIFMLTHAQEKDSIPGKISPALQSLITYNLKGTDSINLVLTTGLPEAFKNERKDAIVVLYEYPPSGILVIRTTFQNLKILAIAREVVFIDLLRKPFEELTTGAYDLSCNQLNYLHRTFPSLNGMNLRASIKELSFDTTDIDLKGRWVNSGMADPLSSSHASIMATMVAGGGNSSEFARGAAPASVLSSSSYFTLLPDADSVYRKFRLFVQNHSYGVGIENYYGSDAAAYDKSVQQNPALLHVFSAGNIGNNTSNAGTYAGITGYANLSGSFKMAKNIITVGAIDSFYNIMSASSKGPAYDGRVKPELVAFGEDGTSGAAALVSGTALLIQQAYQQAHADSFPRAELVKAVLINSADDIGNKQIDYASGFGSLNAINAVTTILQNRYVTGSIVQGQQLSFPITLSSNLASFKVTLSWTDPAATANAAKALVNDLDLVLRNTVTGETWLPWVLNKKPHKDSLALQAQRKVDTLNNSEQVTIDLPPPGNYMIEVLGSELATADQSFAIAWQADTAGIFNWTYPTLQDPAWTNTKIVLRWNNSFTGNATIQYEKNGQWQTITNTADLQKEYFSWITPGEEGTYRLRMVLSTNETFYSDSFVIADPLQIKVGFNCKDSFLLYWNKTGADEYRLYRLGGFYMEPFSQIGDSFIVLAKNTNPSLHYSVAPVLDNWTGKRSLTIDYRNQGVGCYFLNFLAQLQNNYGMLSTQLGSLHEINQVSFLKQTANGFVNIYSVQPASTMIQFTDSFLTRGVNTYKVMIVLNNGLSLYSEPQSIYYFTDRSVIFYPNPAKQGEPVRMIAADFDEFDIEIFDASGKMVYRRHLLNNYEEIPALLLSRGLYMVRIRDRNKNIYSDKIVIY